MDQTAQVRSLLAKASRGDFSSSYDFYDKMMRHIHENIAFVDYNHFRWNKYICEMTAEEYEDYQNYLDDIQIMGMNLQEYFYRSI